MAQDDRHERAENRMANHERFPPTVVDHDNYKNGVELQLLDPGTEEEPRFIWIPNEGESVFAL